MAVHETGDRSPGRRVVRRVLRHWAPYLLTAGTVFTFAAGVGAAIGAERESPLLPAAAGTNPYAGLGALELFVYNGRVSLMLIGGALLFGLPTAYLLLLNGFLLGAGLVEYAETYGSLETLAMVGPHGVIEIPALLLAGAIAFRWCHAGWRTASGTRRSTTMPVFLLESVGAIVLVFVMIGLAALIEGTVAGAIGAAVA